MKKKKKRTAEAVRKYIEERVAREGVTPQGVDGALISGADLQRAAPLIDLIPDPTDRKSVHGMFGVFTKYQVLGMLTDPVGKWTQKYGEIMAQVADEATVVEAEAFTTTEHVGKFG